MLQKHKYLVSWAKASGIKVTGVGIEHYSLSGRAVPVIYIEGVNGTRSVDAADAYNLYWGPKAVTYGNMYHRRGL